MSDYLLRIAIAGVLFATGLLFFVAVSHGAPSDLVFDASMQAPVATAPLQVVTATAPSTASSWLPPPWVIYGVVLALLALLLAWATPEIVNNAWMKKHQRVQVVTLKVASLALTIVKALQQQKPATGATGPELLLQAKQQILDQLSVQETRLLAKTPEKLDQVLTTHVEASVLDVKTQAAQPAQPVAVATVEVQK